MYHLKIKNGTEKKLHYSPDNCWNTEGWREYTVKATWKYSIKMGVRKTNDVDVDWLWLETTHCCEYSDWT
jgi:hypothetical protein